MAAAVVAPVADTDRRISIALGRDMFNGSDKACGEDTVSERDIVIFRDEGLYNKVNHLNTVPKALFSHRSGVSYFNSTNLFYFKIMNSAANIACYKQFIACNSLIQVDQDSKIYMLAIKLIKESKIIFETYEVNPSKGKEELISRYDNVCDLLSAFEKEYISYLLKI